MDAKTIYFVVGLLLGLGLSAVFPQIPIGIKNLYLQYQKQRKEKKNGNPNSVSESSQNYVN